MKQEKSFLIKSLSDTGELEGYFSTFDVHADAVGDCVAPGAFKRTISEWEKSGKYPPLVWNHDMENPDNIIGRVDSIEEDEHGPLMKAHFFDTPTAQHVRNLIKEETVFQFSFAYLVDKERKPNESEKTTDGNIKNVLEEVTLLEVTVTPTPANPFAQVTDIKSGRRNSKKDLETMDAIESSLKDALASLHSLRESVNDNGEPNETNNEPKANDAAVSKEQTEALMIRKGALQERIKNLHIMED